MQRIIYLLLSISCCFFSLPLSSQTVEKGSAQKQADIKRIETLIALGKEVKFSDPELAFEYSVEAYELSEKYNYHQGLMQSSMELGIHYRDQQKARKALNYAETALQEAIQLQNQDTILEAYSLIATIYQLSGRQRKAEEFREKFAQMRKMQRQKEARMRQSGVPENLIGLTERLNSIDSVLTMERETREELRKALQMTEEENMENVAALAEIMKEKAELAKEAAILEMKTAQNELELRESRNYRNMIIAVIAGSVFLIFIGWQRYRFLRQKGEAKLEKERMEKLLEIDRLKDQFLANTSHELRTPLNGIIGMAESLKENLNVMPDNRVKDNLSIIVSSGKRLSNLVNDILDFSRLKNADIKLNKRPVDLYALTNLVFEINRPTIQGKKLKLENRIPEDIPAVWGDENRIHQILQNLIGNAIKFTDQGHVRVYAEIKGDMLEWSVEDTGPGIPEDDRQKIFESFHQSDATTTRAFLGTGLGLPIARQLVELHGGKIEVDSTPGKGSVFTFSIPLVKSELLPEAAEEKESQLQILRSSADTVANPILPLPALQPNEGDKIHVLLVDDEPINLHVLSSHLSAESYDISMATNGEEAIAAIDSGRPYDLVLLDIMMPKISGYEVCKKIREKHLQSELPVIMVTAKNQVKDLVESLNTGANDYLVKPFSRDEFLARVRTQLNLLHLNKATSRFVPNDFLKSLGRENITEVKLGDQVQRKVTIFFSDIRGYTQIAESMSPEENFKFVSALNQRLGPIIAENQGFVNQYLGDGIMAIFSGQSHQALSAAVEIQHLMRRYNEKRKQKKRRQVRIGIGLHTGPLIMGIIGDTKRMDAATIADSVNTASRIENLNKYYGTNILLSGDTFELLGKNAENFNFRRLGQVLLKGKKKPVDVYECIDGEIPDIRDKKLASKAQFDRALNWFFSREFVKASKALEDILQNNPEDATAQLFLNKSLNNAMNEPDEDWTGIEIMAVK